MSKVIPNKIYIVKKYNDYIISKSLPKEKKTYDYRTGRMVTSSPQEYVEIDNNCVSGLHLYSSNGLSIRDDRGFYIPIAVNRLTDFLEKITVIDGELIGEFRYGWDNNKVSIIQVGSEKEKDYEIINKVERKVPKITSFEIGKEYENCKSEKFIYLGKFSIIGVRSSGALIYDNGIQQTDNYENIIYGDDLSGNAISIFEFNTFFRKINKLTSYRVGYCDIFKNEYGHVVIRKGGTKMFLENKTHPSYSNKDLNLKYIRSNLKNNRYCIGTEYRKDETILAFSDNYGFPKNLIHWTMEHVFYDTSEPILSNLNPEQYVFCLNKECVNDKKMIGYYDFSHITRYKDIGKNKEIDLFKNTENKIVDFTYVFPAILWKNKIAITPAGILKV